MSIKHKFRGISIVLMVAVIFSGTISGMVFAVAPESCTWNGSVDSNFSTAANWTGCSGAAPVNTDSLIFPYGVSVTNKDVNNDLSAGLTIGSIMFTGTPSTENNYQISGNSINLTNGISTVSNLIETISLPLVISADQTFSSAGYLHLAGVISGTGKITKTGTGGAYFSGR